MSEDHDTIRALVAEYDTTRLTPEERRVVEEHVAGCASCAELVADVRLLRRQIRSGGEAMFEPHPDPAALRDYARGQGGPESRVGRHIVLCGACRLEVETWRRPPPVGVPSRRPGSDARWLRLGLATAAAALLGVVAGWRFHAAVASRTAARPSGGSPVSTAGGTTPDAGVRVGSTPDRATALAVQAPILHLLPRMQRSGAPPNQRWILGNDESSIGIAVPLVVPASAPETAGFRFEVGPPGGEPVWNQEMTAGRIREHLDAAEMVNLFVVPKQPLAAGEYELRVVPSSAPAGTSPIYRARIEIAYRQSPAATKAPQ